ncbi:YheC/YheD family endospore coat-associated protein [Fuchsiella alkaliacetigena]|uniref:YheC/YheD family endospore coat-associated protein n=1 Tax=Fuchsiella alkaliacetigena TaxID=957042 RepID=UPI00200A7435|nr:YheC/YheD family protein [Fuchsiella alkaliacetigena]MCK8824181.1 YheC/YheD family protein [Fuchsiella alkaliacetigena]
MLIGVYTSTGNPIEVSPQHSYCLASQAKMQGCEVVFFERKDIDYNSKIIEGIIRKNGRWEKEIFPFPDVVIDECLTLDKEVNKGIQEAKVLIDKVPRIKFPTLDKFEIYNKFKKSNKLRQYIPPYDIINSISIVKQYLGEYNRIVVKPIKGIKGNDIIFIEKKDDYYLIKNHTKSHKLSQNQFDYLIKKIIDKTYIVQPYLECRTNLDRPFDFRVHVQRNSTGKWSITKMYARVGNKKSIISNLSQGGMISNIDYFLFTEFEDQAVHTKETLSKIALNIAKYANSIFSYTLDELGVDLSIDKNNKVWLYEINGSPACRFHKWQRARKTVAYAKYIIKNQKK